MTSVILILCACAAVLIASIGFATLKPEFDPTEQFFVTERGEEALADDYARTSDARDSPRVMCSCGNCDGDLGPPTLTMHEQLMRALRSRERADA